MKPNRRSFLLGVAALGGTTLVACGGQAGQQNTTTNGTTITVGLTYIPNIQFSPFYVAESEGLFKDAGISLTLRHHGTQEGLFTALAAGEEQVVFASSDEAMVSAAGGMPELRTFATCYRQYPGVILGAGDIADLSGLAGKTLGVQGRYGAGWYTTLAALDRAGLGEDQVGITEIGWTQVAALTTGKTDAVVGFSNNEAVQLKAAGFPYNQLDVVDKDKPNLVGPGLVTREGVLPVEQLKLIAQAVLEAENRILNNPELALRATEAQVPALAEEAQRKQAEAVLEATSKFWLGTDGKASVKVERDDFTRMGEFLARVGIIEAAPEEPVTVDLPEQTITRGDLVIGFEIDEYTKYRLLNGLDDISMTLQHDDEIGAYEATRPGFKPKTLPVRTADTVS